MGGMGNSPVRTGEGIFNGRLDLAMGGWILMGKGIMTGDGIFNGRLDLDG